MHRLARAAIAAGLVAVVYLAAVFAQVWWASRADDRRPADAIVVLGAAQFDGRPSPVLAARLDHARSLWDDGVAPVIVVTGGRQVGDRFTEATAAADYLNDRGVPDEAIVREVQGTTSYESLAAVARFAPDRVIDTVVLVSDPFHARRIADIATEVGLDAHVSPASDSRVQGDTELRSMVRETAGVAVAHLITHRRLDAYLN